MWSFGRHLILPQQLRVGRIVVAVENEKDCFIRHLDVKQTFIQAYMDETVYMSLPTDCGDMSGKASCCNLRYTDSDGLVHSEIRGLVVCSY